MTAKGNKALASLYCWTVAAYTLAWLQRAKGLHGHYRCTTSRWPSVTCHLGQHTGLLESHPSGSKGCSDFPPQRRWLCRGAASVSHSAVPAPCAAQQRYLPAGARMGKHRAEPQGSNSSNCTASLASDTNGAARCLYRFYSGEPHFFLVLLRINLSLRFVWVNSFKIWPQGGAFRPLI